MRLITFSDAFPATPGPLSSTDKISEKSKLMRVRDIYKYQVSKFVFKCLTRVTPEQFHNWYKLNHEIHHHSTR